MMKATILPGTQQPRSRPASYSRAVGFWDLRSYADAGLDQPGQTKQLPAEGHRVGTLTESQPLLVYRRHGGLPIRRRMPSCPTKTYLVAWGLAACRAPVGGVAA